MKAISHRYPPFSVQAIVTLLYLGLVLLADHIVQGGTITPALLMLGLLGMSFFLGPRWMATTAGLYTFFVGAGFFLPALHRYTSYSSVGGNGTEFSFYLRTITFALVGCFSVLFSIALKKIRTAHREIDEIVSRFPYPLMISGPSGRISYANQGAKERFGLSGKELNGLDFTHLFAPRNRRHDFYFEYVCKFTALQPSESGEGNRNLGIIELEFKGTPFCGDTFLLQ
jgi:PAS domain-containing protein